MLRERELDENSMDCRVIVEFGDLKEKFWLGDGLREFDKVADNVGLYDE
jgi:hypothetical protein